MVEDENDHKHSAEVNESADQHIEATKETNNQNRNKAYNQQGCNQHSENDVVPEVQKDTCELRIEYEEKDYDKHSQYLRNSKPTFNQNFNISMSQQRDDLEENYKRLDLCSRNANQETSEREKSVSIEITLFLEEECLNYKEANQECQCPDRTFGRFDPKLKLIQEMPCLKDQYSEKDHQKKCLHPKNSYKYTEGDNDVNWKYQYPGLVNDNRYQSLENNESNDKRKGKRNDKSNDKSNYRTNDRRYRYSERDRGLLCQYSENSTNRSCPNLKDDYNQGDQHPEEDCVQSHFEAKHNRSATRTGGKCGQTFYQRPEVTGEKSSRCSGSTKQRYIAKPRIPFVEQNQNNDCEPDQCPVQAYNNYTALVEPNDQQSLEEHRRQYSDGVNAKSNQYINRSDEYYDEKAKVTCEEYFKDLRDEYDERADDEYEGCLEGLKKAKQKYYQPEGNDHRDARYLSQGSQQTLGNRYLISRDTTTMFDQLSNKTYETNAHFSENADNPDNEHFEIVDECNYLDEFYDCHEPYSGEMKLKFNEYLKEASEQTKQFLMDFCRQHNSVITCAQENKQNSVEVCDSGNPSVEDNDNQGPQGNTTNHCQDGCTKSSSDDCKRCLKSITDDGTVNKTIECHEKGPVECGSSLGTGQNEEDTCEGIQFDYKQYLGDLLLRLKLSDIQEKVVISKFNQFRERLKRQQGCPRDRMCMQGGCS